MLTHIIVLLYAVKVSVGQINGEFWWLSNKLVNYTHVRPPPPIFEDLSELDNDESAKIVFTDDNTPNSAEAVNKARSDISASIKWPDDKENIVKNDISNHLTERPVVSDRFVFKFPSDDNDEWKNTSSTTKQETENIIENSYFGYVSKPVSNVDDNAENNCVFVKRKECYEKRGLVHQIRFGKKSYLKSQEICCVFPLPTRHVYASPKIYFPGDPQIKRYRRSKDDTNLKQRNILLKQRQGQTSRKATTERIATPDYETNDPYWNIKTFKNPNIKTSNKYNYDTDDYEQDYISEIPRPGLIGLYSDREDTSSSWSTQNDEGYGGADDYDVVDGDSFGYSTVDPRLVTKPKPKVNRRPIKLTTTSDEESYDAESQTISYHSKPNFNVFQDFKLLLKNKVKPSRVHKRTTTVDSIVEASMESLVNEDHVDTGDDKEKLKVFEDCGKTVHLLRLNEQDKQIGDTANGSNPWLALVVPTKTRASILCYATIIHPRAVITVAHCVYRKAPGDVTVITGMWDLNEMSRTKSRVASIRIHPKYKHGQLNHDLAMLYWLRPLKLGLNVQPACLVNPTVGEECMFYGWGGFDQAMRIRPRWQRASVRSCKGSLSLIDADDMPSDAFCATVVSRSTVTGMGGALMCITEGRMSAAGVAVSRDSTLVLLPVRQWVLSAISDLIN